jgi:hypothetical protein
MTRSQSIFKSALDAANSLAQRDRRSCNITDVTGLIIPLEGHLAGIGGRRHLLNG